MSWLLAVLLSGHYVFAHANLKVNGPVPPRSGDTGLKTGPCGGIPRTAAATRINPGATVTVEWQETINHPGRYEFYFSPGNDANFQLLRTVEDLQNNNNLPHNYSTTLTFPNVQCSACTLQMIQVMTETTVPTYYYSCADIALMPATPSPSPTPTPTPAPSPNNCP